MQPIPDDLRRLMLIHGDPMPGDPMAQYDALMRSQQSIGGPRRKTKRQLQDELLTTPSYNPFAVLAGFLGR